MHSPTALAAHIRQRVSLTDEELAQLLAFFTPKMVKKKQFVVQPGFVATARNYVTTGVFRAYVIGKDGREHTTQFAIDDWWISDYNSYIFQQPATMFVVALEDSYIWQLDYNSEQQAKQAHHKFETFFRIQAERAAAFHQRRIISSLTHSAEERYAEFLARYPLIVQRVPQHTLASYLHMTAEFLSKIRSGKARK